MSQVWQEALLTSCAWLDSSSIDPNNDILINKFVRDVGQHKKKDYPASPLLGCS